MSIRNNNWYNLQSTRNYPLADDATTTGDSGERFPEDVLVDCHLRWPDTLGRYAFVSGVTVTARLVTVLISASDSPAAMTDFVPLAAVSLVKPVDSYRPYSVTPLAAGVGGFLVFGDVNEQLCCRFSTPQQGLLAYRAARPYRALPIPTMRKLGLREGLAGLVRLVAGTDLEMEATELIVGGLSHLQPAIIIRLKQAIANRNVLQVYTGPCDKRPESHTCDREGITEVNGVQPDCNGNLNIIFAGVSVVPFADCSSWGGGVALATDVNLADACLTTTAERFLGQDYCVPSSSVSLSAQSEPSDSSEAAPGSSEAPPVESLSSEYVAWPVDLDFSDGAAPDFVVKSGNFVFEDAGDGDTYAAVDGSRRNVSVWDPGAGYTASSLDKRCVVRAQIVSRSTTQRNAGMVVNYRIANPITNPHPEYLLVELDPINNAVHLKRFTGEVLIAEHSVTCANVIRLDDWYVIDVTTQAGVPGQVILDISVTGETDPAWTPVSFSLATNRFGTATGRFGVGSDRAHARFATFLLEDR